MHEPTPNNPEDASQIDSDEQPERSTDQETAEDATSFSDAEELGREMTAEELDEARRYGRVQLVLTLVDHAVDLVYLGLMAFVFAVPLTSWIQGFERSTTLELLTLFVIVFTIHVLISLPISFVSGWWVESKFDLSNQTAFRWFRRYLERMVLGLVFGMAVFTLLFWIIWLTGSYWWLVAAGAFFVLNVLIGQLVPVLILPMQFKIEKLEREDLSERMARLTEGTGLSIEGIYRMGLSQETKKANAMLAGLGHTRRVLIGDTLLSGFSPDEIEVIFAHEVGHHVHRHIVKLIVIGAVFSAVSFWCYDRIATAWVGVESFDQAPIPVVALPLLMFLTKAFTLLAEPLQNAIMRHFERQCDAYALERTQMQEAYQSAFRKLAVLNKDDPDPHPLEVFLFHSHPPISERLAMAER